MMSGSVSLKELLNLAIGSPELGAVNFNALHSLLRGLMEHLQLGDVRRTLSPEEREFIQPGSVPVEDAGRPSTLFHQLQDKVTKMEARLLQLDSLPSSSSLLQGSQSQNKPVEEMWQLMQLKKRMEVNENGVTKAMGAFQELLSTFNSLQQANNSIQERLASLSDMVTKINIREVEKRLQDLDGQTRNIPLLMDRMEGLQNRLGAYPEAGELVTWPSLHDALTDNTFQSQLDELEKKKLNREELMLELNLLSRSDLDFIHKDLEELWRFLKKHLNTGQAFDPDGAAGFRKKLFERVKCISCDRPVTMATGPHLVTVRTAPLIPRNRPHSAEFRNDQSLGDPQQVTDPEFQYTESPRPHTSCSMHRKTTRSQNLTTVYPYGDPGQIQYKNSEFDLMGIDGVMYKGRMEANNIAEREAAVKTPQPPYRTTIERARSAAPHFRSHGASNTRTPNHSARTSRTAIQVPSTPDTSPPIFHVPSAAEPTNLFQSPLTTKDLRGDP